MIAIDWSHSKGLTVYDGKKLSVIDRKAFLKRLAGESNSYFQSSILVKPASDGVDGESNHTVQSNTVFNPTAPSVVLEQGCPLSLIYDILKTGFQVNVISNRATQDYRVKHRLEKSDENDARIIYELANNGARLVPTRLDDKDIQLLELYQRYKRYQKARVAMMHMRKAYIRHFGDSQSILPYDIGIDTLKATESSCLKKIVELAPPVPDSIKIKGLGSRLWAGIIITANPANFPSLSSYLRYCGLVNLEQLDHKWNRHARGLYHMIADSIMKHRDANFRPIYDNCKRDIALSHPTYTKLHIHNAALNRTATFLAKEFYKNLCKG